eukprot:m.230026 g.230026  ORF g.230026 m.230026 type:complete len:184 (+) comp19252_c0_seq2:465-1016(+)
MVNLYWCAAGCFLVSVFGCTAATEQIIDAGNAMIDWSGRINRTNKSVSFDWLGVTARIAVRNAKYVTATIQTSAASRGTRMRVFISDQGFDLYPEAQFWVTPYINTTMLFASNAPKNTLLTMSNIVDPRYGTGITTVVSFATDGTFEVVSPQTRRMVLRAEFLVVIVVYQFSKHTSFSLSSDV